MFYNYVEVSIGYLNDKYFNYSNRYSKYNFCVFVTAVEKSVVGL